MFESSYRLARERFLRASASAAAHHLQLTEPGWGVDGEILSVDVAEVVPTAVRRTVLVTSGCHGIEGYAGSTVQCALLGDLSFLRALQETGTRLVLVHALNPHGFSYGRRVTAEGVDLNRNAVDFLAPLPRNEGYASLHSFLVPPQWPPSANTESALQGMIARMGLRDFQAAISAGQYEFPTGLFFGGWCATWALAAFDGILVSMARNRLPTVWIDLHTGLGSFAQAERIFTGGGGDIKEALTLARQLWGTVTQQDDGSSVATKLTGMLSSLARARLGDLLKASLTWEMGTLPPLDMLLALRADACTHLAGTSDPTQRETARELMRAAFCPDSEAWRHEVLAQGRAVVEAAVTSKEWD